MDKTLKIILIVICGLLIFCSGLYIGTYLTSEYYKPITRSALLCSADGKDLLMVFENNNTELNLKCIEKEWGKCLKETGMKD